ncbi:hypothetical protein CCHR01_04865 [Colletotrichum chrysophilum]|uniref:Uncharacterized protein n=1 Tax=Colletotrichum chrysophilum TaxID=1836956 RepID=A0AAD9AQB7_9PEZI|nr:hypothetical protein CCHR01_04865 [Colletotrichum chrysophilum]
MGRSRRLPVWDTDTAVLSGRGSRPAVRKSAPAEVPLPLHARSRRPCEEWQILQCWSIKLTANIPSIHPRFHSHPLPAGPAPNPTRLLHPHFPESNIAALARGQPFFLRRNGWYLCLHFWFAVTPCHNRGSPPSKLRSVTHFTEANDTP